MGWPKGMPRKGHINKSGSRHATWGERAAKAVTEAPAAKRRGRPRKDGLPSEKKWETKLTNKGLEYCGNPDCGFPEAYAGYCNECGWMRPMRYGRIT